MCHGGLHLNLVVHGRVLDRMTTDMQDEFPAQIHYNTAIDKEVVEDMRALLCEPPAKGGLPSPLLPRCSQFNIVGLDLHSHCPL
jgi:hypothetical protein